MFTKLMKSDEGFDVLLLVLGTLAIYLLSQIVILGQLLMVLCFIYTLKTRKWKQACFFGCFVIYPFLPMMSFVLGFGLFFYAVFGGNK